MTGGTHRLESRMREIRPSGSEGGGAGNRSPYPYQGLTSSDETAGAPRAIVSR
jgi:hypothetical protein